MRSIYDINGLIKCMNNKIPFCGYLLSDDLVFMYVKNYCGYSKRACTRLIDNGMTNVKVVDVISKLYSQSLENLLSYACIYLIAVVR